MQTMLDFTTYTILTVKMQEFTSFLGFLKKTLSLHLIFFVFYVVADAYQTLRISTEDNYDSRHQLTE